MDKQGAKEVTEQERVEALEDLLIEALEELNIQGRTDHAEIYRRACALLDAEPGPDIILTRRGEAK